MKTQSIPVSNLFFIVLFCLPLTLHAAVLQVETDGTIGIGDVDEGKNCPADVEAVIFADFAAALVCAADGDEIHMGEGQFPHDEDLSIDIENNLTILGQGMAATTLALESDGVFLRVAQPVGMDPITVDIQSLTIENGGGASVSGASILSMKWIHFDTGTIGLDGYLRAGSGSTLTFDASRVSGVLTDSPLVLAHGDAALAVFRRSTMDQVVPSGGIVLFRGSNGGQVVVENATIANNTVSTNNSGRIFNGVGFTITHSTIADNQGAARIFDDVSGTISHSVFRQVATSCGGSANLSSIGNNFADANGADCSGALNHPSDVTNVALALTGPVDVGDGRLAFPVPAGSPVAAGGNDCLGADGEPLTEDIRGFPRRESVPCTPGSWQYDPIRGIGRIVFADDGQRRYTATTGGGIFRSDDGGESWSEIGAATLENAVVNDLVVDPQDGDRLIAGVFGSGIWISADAGDNWSQSNTGLDDEALKVTRLAVDPTNGNWLWAGTFDGLYRSTDGGSNWTRVNDGLPE